ncbi:MAG: hypothetical protein JSR87_00935 [Proteobacteria bacterium]|nr:hypothetical protein [Pseudomonadota bacterium]MBS0572383.1 hypothetical protein [Pseudomonadota bacterium]
MFLSSLLCLPPYLAMQMFQRSCRRARRRGLPTTRYSLAIYACLGAFLFNLAVFAVTVRALAQGGGDFGPLQTVAVAVAWVTFWLWLFLAVSLGRNVRRGRGLR